MFRRSSFGASSFSPTSWKFDGEAPRRQPLIDTSTPGGRGAREAAEIARRNEELIAMITNIVTSGALECP